MPATYTSAEQQAITPNNLDSADLTNVAIQISDERTTREQPERSLSCSGGGIISTLVRSNTLRYLAVLAVVALLVFILERFLGATATAQELRAIIVENIKGIVQQAALDASPKPTEAARQ
jgi:hypothetical protein